MPIPWIIYGNTCTAVKPITPYMFFGKLRKQAFKAVPGLSACCTRLLKMPSSSSLCIPQPIDTTLYKPRIPSSISKHDISQSSCHLTSTIVSPVAPSRLRTSDTNPTLPTTLSLTSAEFSACCCTSFKRLTKVLRAGKQSRNVRLMYTIPLLAPASKLSCHKTAICATAESSTTRTWRVRSMFHEDTQGHVTAASFTWLLTPQPQPFLSARARSTCQQLVWLSKTGIQQY